MTSRIADAEFIPEQSFGKVEVEETEPSANSKWPPLIIATCSLSHRIPASVSA
jgi:hypothetical protein